MKGKGRFFIRRKKEQDCLIPVADKENFSDYMRKEIFTQPELINNFLQKYINADKINFDFLKIRIDKIKRIYIAGSGEAYGAVLAGAYNFEVLADIVCVPVLLSEFNFSNPILDKSTLVIIVSGSKNDVQFKTAQKRVNNSGAKLIGIFDYDNESSFAVSLDFVQGATVSTASYNLRYLALAMLALYFGEKNQVVTQLYIKIATRMLITLGDRVKRVLEGEYIIKHMAEKLDGNQVILTGTNVDFATAIYGAYVLSFAFNRNVNSVPLGEIGLLQNEQKNIIAFASNENFYNLLVKSLSDGVRITPYNVNPKDTLAVCYDDTIPLLNPVLSTVVIQLTAYNIAKNNNLSLI